VRASYMVGEMQLLAAEHPAARARFVALRDHAQTQLGADHRDYRALGDWILLNDVVGEPLKTLDWFDQFSGDPSFATALDRCGRQLADRLVRKGRWADMAKLY